MHVLSIWFGGIKIFWGRNLNRKTWYSSKSLWILSVFVVWYFGTKMFWYPQIIYHCAPFTDCISKITNTQKDCAKEIDVVMLIYDLIECNDNCLRTSTLANSVSLKSMMKITGKSPEDGNAKNVEIEVPLKYLSNFWRTLEMPLINCKTNLFAKHGSQLALWPIQQGKQFWK